MVAVSGLVEWREAVPLWTADRKDPGLMVLTFVAPLSLRIEEGILAGMVVSLVVVIYRSSAPHTAVMRRLPGTDTYRNLNRNPEALTRSDVVVVRMDANLYFATVSSFRDLVRRVDTQGSSLRSVAVDMSPVNRIDSTRGGALPFLVVRGISN